jgi:allantoicase
MQQKSADRSQKANNMKQHIENRTRSFRHSDRAVARLSKKTKCYNRTIKVDAKHQSKKSKDEIKNSGCLSEGTKDSVHPNSSNTWGECHANIAHKNMAKKRQGTKKLTARPHPLARMMYLLQLQSLPLELWTLCPLCLQSQMTCLHSRAWTRIKGR